MAKIKVEDDEFWCVICQAVKKLSGGAKASIEVGGWYCSHHKISAPNKVLHPTPESGGTLPAVESNSENVLPA